MPDRLIIVDNCLVDSRGHHLSVATTLSNHALRCGTEVVWYAHQSLPEQAAPAGVMVRRSFSRSTYQLLAEGRDDLDLSDAYVEALHEIAGSSSGTRTRVLLHTADGHVFRALAKLAGAARQDFQAVTIHASTPYETRLMPGGAAAIDPVLLQLASSGWADHGLYVWGETARLAAIFRKTYGIPAEELPLPAPHWVDEPPPNTDPRLQVAYLGAAREDKGFCKLAALAGAARSDRALADRVQFIVQASPPQRGYRPALTQEMAALQKISSVSVIPHNLPANEYQKLVNSADVVLMLYDVSKYAARGSGIAIEALSAGKFLLATTGMFLEDLPNQQAIAYGTDIEQWVAALRAWSRDVPGLRQAGAALGRQFRQGRTAAVYLDRLIKKENSSGV